MASGDAMTTSNSMNPPLTRSARSSKPTTSAPAALASSALAPWANTATRTVFAGTGGHHDGTADGLVGLLASMPRLTATSMDSSNLAVAVDLASVSASATA